ncbi:MAG TPA: carboxyl transferase domain-containing protein [Actinomycetota bacterium]|nr:carboxyl transferase domain-containing protein [Actinomycetota bacterium]
MPHGVPEATETLIDAGSFVPSGDALAASDPLGFPGYGDALARAEAASGAAESVVTGAASVAGVAVEVAAFEFSFLGGSMGTRTGELLARAVERAARRGVPFVLRTATGGARMQEGMASLVQMPKVVAARLALAAAGTPFVAILGSPTTGGVLASLAALADVTIAEAGATIGFAGPRVVEAATGRPPGGDSHSAESALQAGLVDAVVAPGDARDALATVLSILTAAGAPASGDAPAPAASDERDPWDAVRTVRGDAWPLAPDLARSLAGSFFELRGDRAGGDDPACVAGLATIAGRRAVVLTLDRTRPPGPRAYRKAIRCVRLAAGLGIPVVTLVDTPGADPSEESERGGIAWAIAELFEAMLTAPVPVVSVVTGEGGSGGALAFATADVLLAYEDAVFEVIAPELAATILWRDGGRAAEAARLLRIGAASLASLGICDEVLPGRPEPRPLAAAVAYHLARLANGAPGEARRDRWRNRRGE